MKSLVRLQSLLVLALLTAPATAFGQSAADKATARKLATQGIELHGQGKYAEALDKLERAEALYDAPVHLVYIARSQAKLGQFVEASETYRRLGRVELTPSAPAAFREAIEDGRREAPDVEAKIGSLRLDITPANVQGLELSIDGQNVSAAVVGVERPVNPGKHSIHASAPGYRAADVTADIAIAEKETVRLELALDPTAPPPTKSGAPGATSARADASSASPDAEEIRNAKPRDRDDPNGLNVFFGLRVGGALPGGKLYKNGDTEVAASDYFKTGVMVELNAGAWFAGYFGAKVFVEGGSFAPGSTLDRLEEFPAGPSAKVENSTSARGFGLSAMVGTPPRRFGAFGEIGVVFAQELAVTRTFSVEGHACGDEFEQTLGFSGPGLRLGGAARIPVSTFFQLTPYVLASFGQTNSVTNKSKCPAIAESTSWPKSGNVSDVATHTMIIVGIGGDVLFGVR